MNIQERDQLYEAVLQLHGQRNVLDVALGEAHELANELCHMLRGKKDFWALAGEIADLEICTEQLARLDSQVSTYECPPIYTDNEVLGLRVALELLADICMSLSVANDSLLHKTVSQAQTVIAYLVSKYDPTHTAIDACKTFKLERAYIRNVRGGER